MGQKFVIDNYKESDGMEDSLCKDSFTVIKEPMGTYLIGYPFNKRFNNPTEVCAFLAKEVGTVGVTVNAKINALDSYGMLVLKLSKGKVEPATVEYLYSIPSYTGGGQ